MFRSLIKESTMDLESTNDSIKKIRGFQKKLNGVVKKTLGQRVGEVKKTLPTAKSKMDDCLKKVGDADLCAILLTKYSKFYNDVCLATPALCDDNQPVQPKPIPRILQQPERSKRNIIKI